MATLGALTHRRYAAPAPRSRESELQATAAEAQSVASQLEGEMGAARRAIEEKERRMLELEKQIVAMRKAISQGKDQLLATKDMQVGPREADWCGGVEGLGPGNGWCTWSGPATKDMQVGALLV